MRCTRSASSWRRDSVAHHAGPRAPPRPPGRRPRSGPRCCSSRCRRASRCRAGRHRSTRSAAARPATRPTTSRPATSPGACASRASPRGREASPPRQRSCTISTGITRLANGMNQLADRPPGTEAGAAATECLVVLGRPEHPDDEEHHDHDLGQHEQRRRRAHEVVRVLSPLQDVGEVPTPHVTDHRDPVGERDGEERRRRPASLRSRRSARGPGPGGRATGPVPPRRVAAVVEAVAEAATTAAEAGAGTSPQGAYGRCRPGAGDLGACPRRCARLVGCRPRS